MATVLLVEDDINLREIYAARLSAEDYVVVVASDGEEALAKSVRTKPDLILLDVMMPKISGFDVLDILRSTPETRTTKVVMLTALSQDSDRERGEKLGVNKYLVKSQITLEDVVDTVKALLAEVQDSTAIASKKPSSDSARVDAAVKSLKNAKITKKEGFLKPDDKKSKKSPDGDAEAIV